VINFDNVSDGGPEERSLKTVLINRYCYWRARI